MTHPTVRYLFRGFRCFKSVSLQSIVGELNIGGNYSVTDYNRITGFLIAEKSNNDAHQVSEWYTDANRLLDHAMLIMSFASGTYLRVPVKEYFCGREVRTEFYNVSKVDEPTWPAFRSLDLLPIFTSAVDSFDSLSKRVRMLNFAVEWMLLPTTYNEVRLISRMTALENLLYHNFEKNNEFLGASRFGKFAKKVRDLIRDLNIEEDTAEMSKKVGELNRRSLKARIEALLKEWGVPMADLPDDSVGEIVAARNRIVHRGVYYEPEENNQKELFYHVVLLNEIVTRVLLTLLRFRGHYECYLGGHHRRSFPECRRV